MASEFGRRLRVNVFGESHGPKVGAVISGLPAGEAIDAGALSAFLARRRGGKGLTTARAEGDCPVFVSGVRDGRTCASPLCLLIDNADARSADYDALSGTSRPGHADYTAYVKWKGLADARGGGHFSGRLTAPVCAAGGIALQILSRRGVFAGAHLLSVGAQADDALPPEPSRALLEALAAKEFPALSDARGQRMRHEIERAAREDDSVGGVVECAVIGLCAGLGEPMFDGVENRMAAALFGIPAVKGVDFGAGFEAASMRGSACNDEFYTDDAGRVRTYTNRAGGILGGITNGMPVVARCAFKPTPTIGRSQRTVRLADGAQTQITARGRHDPCVALRAVPVVEAVMALVALDLLLEGV